MTVKKKILVITSDPLMLRFLQQNLSESDYQMIGTQHSGAGLKAVLDKEVPDLVILDTRKDDSTVDLFAAREIGGYNPN